MKFLYISHFLSAWVSAQTPSSTLAANRLIHVCVCLCVGLYREIACGSLQWLCCLLMCFRHPSSSSPSLGLLKPLLLLCSAALWAAGWTFTRDYGVRTLTLSCAQYKTPHLAARFRVTVVRWFLVAQNALVGLSAVALLMLMWFTEETHSETFAHYALVTIAVLAGAFVRPAAHPKCMCGHLAHSCS